MRNGNNSKFERVVCGLFINNGVDKARNVIAGAAYAFKCFI